MNEKLEGQEEVEVAEELTSAEEETPLLDDSTGEQEETLEASEQDASVEPQEPAYEPNFKYTANDEEREFDERLKAVIKSKEDEEWLRDVFSKADGFENMKSNRDERIETARQRYETLKAEHEQITQNLEPLSHMLETGDLDNLIPALGLTNEQIIKHAYKLAQLESLPPEERMRYNQSNELRTREYELQKQNETLSSQLEQQRVQQTQQQMHDALNAPDVSDIVRAFDQRNGQNSFFREVAQRGALVYQNTGRLVPPQEIVKEIINQFGLSQQATQQESLVQTKPQPTRTERPAVIPNTGRSGSGTPVKRKISSLDQMRAMAKDLSD